MNSTAVITLERVWGTETSPYNTASIKPFIDGIKAFSDSFDFYYSHFYREFPAVSYSRRQEAR